MTCRLRCGNARRHRDAASRPRHARFSRLRVCRDRRRPGGMDWRSVDWRGPRNSLASRVPTSFGKAGMRVDEVPERIVVDASLGLKWVLQEEHSDRAAALGPGRELLTSALFWAECRQRDRHACSSRRDLDRASGNDALRDLQDVRPLHTRPLDAAAVIVRAGDCPRSGASRSTTAAIWRWRLEEDAIVVTADRRFRSAVAAHPSLADRVVLLRDIVLR